MICGRGQQATNHFGNRRLRVLVEASLENYANANKIVKGSIVSNIIDTIRGAASHGGGFVKRTASGTWVEVGCSVAREKVGQIFRELLARRDPQKMQSRKERRKKRRAKRALMASRTSSSSSTTTGQGSFCDGIVSYTHDTPKRVPDTSNPLNLNLAGLDSSDFLSG